MTMELREQQIAIAENKLVDNIINWVNMNTSTRSNSEVWKVGLVSAENLMAVQSAILEDMSCVNWKFWNCDDFKIGFSLLKFLHKSPMIFKSEFNNYLEKGRYLFVYKTPLSKHEYYFNTRHYKGQLQVVD